MKLEPVETSQLLEDWGDVQLWTLGADRLDEFTDYIYRIYHQTRSKRYNWVPENEYDEMKEDGRRYFENATVAAVLTPDGKLLGTWGLILKDTYRDSQLVLPIEKRFGLDADAIRALADAPEVQFIFNGWRTAIDKDLLEEQGFDGAKSIFIFDLLLRGLTRDFGDENEKWMGVAEMEDLVLRYHKRIGVPWMKLGEPRTYWGNKKFPCAFKVSEYMRSLKELHPERYDLLYGLPLGEGGLVHS